MMTKKLKDRRRDLFILAAKWMERRKSQVLSAKIACLQAEGRLLERGRGQAKDPSRGATREGSESPWMEIWTAHCSGEVKVGSLDSSDFILLWDLPKDSGLGECLPVVKLPEVHNFFAAESETHSTVGFNY